MVSLPKQLGRKSSGVRATVTINEDAFKRAAQRLRKAPQVVHQHRVTLGIHEDKGDAQKVNYRGQGTAAKVLEIAAAMEFGTDLVPERSFIREWFDTRRPALMARMKEAIKQEYEEQDYSGQARSQAITAFAEDLLQDLLNRMRAGISPDLAERTKQERQAAGLPEGPPLIATKQLSEAIACKVDGFQVGS